VKIGIVAEKLLQLARRALLDVVDLLDSFVQKFAEGCRAGSRCRRHRRRRHRSRKIAIDLEVAHFIYGCALSGLHSLRS